MSALGNVGFARIGFTYAFQLLREGANYEDAISKAGNDTKIGAVLLEGGDTDTNAAIVGGMIGAAVGIDKIPAHMKDPVLSFKPGKGKPGIIRPKFLIPADCNLIGILDKVYENSPKETTKIFHGEQDDKKEQLQLSAAKPKPSAAKKEVKKMSAIKPLKAKAVETKK